MSKEMIISVNGREKKIAILDNGRVTEFYIERGEENSGIVGNIYKGRVQRVLPGMQSAFVSIGLERDAFLYVSDFFDEEEEIERIVMEKSKKGSQEDARKEANDRIERARIEREKQMESAQEIGEPLVESDTTIELEPVETPADERPSGRKGRGRRDRRDREEPQVKAAAPAEAEDEGVIAIGEPIFEFEDAGFERIIDDEDTGEMFKDAYRQEAIVDKVRAVEFDMERIDEAEVGSVLSSFQTDSGGFERIADDDEPAAETSSKKPSAKAKSTRGSKKKTETADVAESETEVETEKKPAKKGKAKTATAAKSKKTTKAKSKKAADEGEPLPDSEASVKEAAEVSEMAVRRGGRGRRRGGRGRKPDGTENGTDAVGVEDGDGDDSTAEGIEEVPVAVEAAPIEVADEIAEPAAEAKTTGDAAEPVADGRENRGDRDRSRGRRDKRGGRSDSRDDRRPERGEKSDRPERAERSERPERNERNDRNDRGDRGERRSQPTISDLLREGQEILVQIAKEPIAKKGARITSHIALPGRFLVYMPTIEHLGVSRKIESSSERGRLRTLIQRIRQDEEIPSGGFIVRTAGIGISEEDLRQDARYLVRTWIDLKKKTEKSKSPALVHQDLDIVQRLLRDHLSDDFTAIRVDSEEEYLRTVEFINRIQPRMVNRVKLYTREDPILEAYGVQEEIEKALKPRVWLKSGGYLVINQTEALVAIDVNTGKFVGKGNARLEDTITRTNMEAVDEIARQIRLRDLGGIIVLDLIDMEDRRNRHRVSQALQEALADDKSPTKVLSFNDFGLIIMTRKRVKQSLERTMCAPCEYCEGAGWVKSPTTVCYEILAEARRLSKHLDDVRQTTLRIHPDVSKALRSSERAVLEEIEAYLGNVDLTADPTIHQAQFDFAFI